MLRFEGRIRFICGPFLSKNFTQHWQWQWQTTNGANTFRGIGGGEKSKVNRKTHFILYGATKSKSIYIEA